MGENITESIFGSVSIIEHIFDRFFFQFRKSRKFRMFHSSVHHFVLVPGCCEDIKKVSWIRTKLFQGSTFLSLHIFK